MKKIFALILLIAMSVPSYAQFSGSGSFGRGSGGAGSFTTVTTSASGSNLAANVGINSAAPGQTLDVQGTIRANNIGINTTNAISQLSIGGNTSIGAAYSTIAAPSNGMIVQGNTGIKTSAPVNAVDINGGAVIGTFAATRTAPTNGLAVSGNIGIGTHTPTHALDVWASTGTAILSVGNNQGSNPLIYLQTDGTSNYTAFNSRNNFPFAIQTNNITGFWMDTNQNVGIGTVVPRAQFDVTASGSQKFSVLSGGNVGIGSVTPGQKLDVQGTVRINSGYTLESYDSNGVKWNCRPAITTGVFTCA